MTYTIKLLPSGHTFEAKEGKKLLDAGLSAGVSLPYGCRMGSCNTCKAHIVSGDFDFGDAHPSYLPESERAKGMALLCQAKACSDLVIEVTELPKLMPAQTLTAMVKRIEKVAPDVMVVDLRLALHQGLIFAAGQYVDLLLDGGVRRSYSIASVPAAPMTTIDLQLHLRHMPGGVFTDRAFAGGLKLRDKLQIEAPLGTFFLREDSDKPIVMLASGTGYAPIRSILLDMARRGIDRPIVLYWGGRRPTDLYAMAEVEQWAAARPNLRFVPVLSEARPEDAWGGRQGFVHRAVLDDFVDLSGHQVYACGAPLMVNAARRDFTGLRGLPEAEFFADSFISQADTPAEPVAA